MQSEFSGTPRRRRTALPILRGETGDFKNEFAADGAAEILETFRHHDERARAADHAVFEIEVEVGDLRQPVGLQTVVDNGQAVDGAVTQR